MKIKESFPYEPRYSLERYYRELTRAWSDLHGALERVSFLMELSPSVMLLKETVEWVDYGKELGAYWCRYADNFQELPESARGALVERITAVPEPVLASRLLYYLSDWSPQRLLR